MFQLLAQAAEATSQPATGVWLNFDPTVMALKIGAVTGAVIAICAGLYKLIIYVLDAKSGITKRNIQNAEAEETARIESKKRLAKLEADLQAVAQVASPLVEPTPAAQQRVDTLAQSPPPAPPSIDLPPNQ